jgi:tetratricopeptide (TPR) repeat protein
VSSAFFLADSRVGPSQKLVTAALVAALGFLSLVPRVAGQHIPKVGLAQVDSYARLDTVKNKNLTLVARNYFLEEGDSRDAKVEEDKWAAYPEERLLEQADIAVRSGSYPEAIASYRQALAANPINIPTYVYLGQLYNRLGQFDSAVSVMEIARGLAPRNPGVNTTLGLAYWSSGKKTKGERLCRFAIRLDPTMAKPYYYLANMCRESGREAEYESNLAQAVSKTDATAAMLADMAELEAERGDYQPAALNFRRAMDKGMDSSRVRRVVQKHPQLSRYLPGL